MSKHHSGSHKKYHYNSLKSLGIMVMSGEDNIENCKTFAIHVFEVYYHLKSIVNSIHQIAYSNIADEYKMLDHYYSKLMDIEVELTFLKKDIMVAKKPIQKVCKELSILLNERKSNAGTAEYNRFLKQSLDSYQTEPQKLHKWEDLWSQLSIQNRKMTKHLENKDIIFHNILYLSEVNTYANKIHYIIENLVKAHSFKLYLPNISTLLTIMNDLHKVLYYHLLPSIKLYNKSGKMARKVLGNRLRKIDKKAYDEILWPPPIKKK